MNNYKRLMTRQCICEEVTEQFYKKLEEKETYRKPIRWQAILISACIALMVPLTAIAAKNIFGKPKVKIGEISLLSNMEGYTVRFENLNNYPLDAFPKEHQTLKEDKDFYYDSWEEAENALGIDLLDNTVLANAKKSEYYFPITDSIAHCVTGYRTEGGRLYYIGTEVSYQYEHLNIELLAKITVENPKLDEDVKQILHGITVGFDNPDISYREYTTKEGIPVIIVKSQVKDYIYYSAIFAVNDISYEIRSRSSQKKYEIEEQILLNVLDGFKLNN